MSKTTLCQTCEFGLVRGWEYYDAEIEGHSNKCLLGGDYVEIVTACNKYSQDKNAETTYHDPTFQDYVEKIIKGESEKEKNDGN